MTTMRAVVLAEPGPVDHLQLRDLPIPEPDPGWVRIAVRAFGLNRSELHLRLGLAQGARLPIVPGIEAVGVVDAAPGGDLRPGQQVAALMGGMGRVFNGGYAEYTVVAKDLGATVLATTRRRDRLDVLAAHGVDHPLLDDGAVAGQVRRIVADGVDAALELVGTPTLPDTLSATRVHGTVCFAGMLSNQWTVPDFYPIAYLPRGVRLSAYGGDAADLPAAVLQRSLDRIADGTLELGPVRTFPLEQIRAAHRALEDNTGSGKIVVSSAPDKRR